MKSESMQTQFKLWVHNYALDEKIQILNCLRASATWNLGVCKLSLLDHIHIYFYRILHIFWGICPIQVWRNLNAKLPKHETKNLSPLITDTGVCRLLICVSQVEVAFLHSGKMDFLNIILRERPKWKKKKKGLFPSPYTVTEPTGSVAVYGYITKTRHITRSPYTVTEPIHRGMVR